MSVLDRIPTLSDRELRGWWWCVVVERIRDQLPGERAALLARARELGLEIKGVDRV